MSGDRLDRDLDALLGPGGGELGTLYRRLPQAEPPRRLDRAVLAEAARAVRGAGDRPPRRQRWLLGLGSVAGMVLAAGIAWQAMPERGVPAAGSAPAPQQTTPAGVIPVEPILAPPPAPSPPPPAPPAVEAAPAPSASPPRARTASPPAIEQKAQARPAPPAAAPAADAREAPVAESAAAAQRQEAEKAAAPAVPAPAEATPSRAAPGLSPAPITSTELRRNMRLPPARWLDEIRRLDREGQRHWAGENLRLFRRVHPRQAIPADLQPLLDD